MTIVDQERAASPASGEPATGPRPGAWRRLGTRAGAVWAGMDGAGTGRRLPGTGTVAVVAMAAQTAAAGISVGNGSALWYADALNHLVIAARITNGFNAGVQQLGTVWLPAPHLILAPFASNQVLWATGWAAGIVGILAMGASAAALYRIAARIGLGRAGRLVACLLFVGNPGVLYLYSTAMTESVLLAALLASIAGLAHFAVAKRPLSGGELAVFAGIPATVAVLSRYEGWVLVAAGAVFILVTVLRRRRLVPRAARPRLVGALLPPLAAITVLPALAILWWLGYNYVNFGDPLEFVVGQYSAFAQQRDLVAGAELSTEGNLAASLTVLGASTWQIAGWVTVILGLAGAAWLIATNGFGTKTLVAGVLLSPWVFNLLALYLGQTVLRNEFSVPPGLFNSRYALTGLAFLALCAGVAVHAIAAGGPSRFLGRWRVVVLPVAAAAALGQSLVIGSDLVARSPIYAEGALQQQIRETVDPVWDTLAADYDGTGILVDEVATTLQLRLEIPIGDLTMLASGERFDEALHAPTRYVGWVLVNTADRTGEYHQDAVLAAMLEHPENFTAYQPVARAGDLVLYRLAAAG